MINRTSYYHNVNYDIIKKSGDIQNIRNTVCFITLSQYKYQDYDELDSIKIYLKDNRSEEIILDWVELLNNIVPGYSYNSKDNSITFKFINKLHLKWSYTVIRYLWEPYIVINYDKYKDYRTVIENALYLYKNFQIDALNAIFIGHYEVEKGTSNHGCFFWVTKFFKIHSEKFIELLTEKPKNCYQDLHTVLDTYRDGDVIDNKDFNNIESVIKYFKLEKRNQMLKIFVVGGSTHYANWIENSELVNAPEKADLLLFTGGEDVDPSLYKQNIGKHTYINKKRDEYEKFMFNKFKHKMKLGVCRGSQLVTVLSGGRLIQHVNGHTSPHTIEDLQTGKIYPMTSTHHQMCYPYITEHVLIAVASKNLSNVYFNGDNGRCRLVSGFREPEIIYYPKTNSLGIQGHPEMFVNKMTDVKDYLNSLINKYLKKENVYKEVKTAEQSST